MAAKYRYFYAPDDTVTPALLQTELNNRGIPLGSSVSKGGGVLQYQVLLEDDMYGLIKARLINTIICSDTPLDNVSFAGIKREQLYDRTSVNSVSGVATRIAGAGTQTVYTVPAGKTLHLVSMGITCSLASNLAGNKACYGILLRNGVVWCRFDLQIAGVDSKQAQKEFIFNPPVQMAAGQTIQLTAACLNPTASVSATMSGWIE